MAGAEPRDFYLFMWIVGICLRADIVVMFKKGGRPQCKMQMILVPCCIINEFEQYDSF